MQPDPHIPQDQGHADEQQPQNRLTTPGADARLMPLPIGRFDAKAPPIGRSNPTQGAMRDTPGGIQEGLSPVPPSVAPRIVTDHRQLKFDGALLRAPHGIGGPVGLCFFGRQRVGSGGAPGVVGFLPRLTAGRMKGNSAGSRSRITRTL